MDRQLTDSDELLNTFRRTIHIKQAKFQKQLEALKVLEESIVERTSEVHHKIHTLHDAVYEWQTSIYLLNEHMRIAGYYLSDRFHIWHQTIPILNSWFSSEDKVHQSIYNTSWLVGLHEEIRAMAEIYAQIQVSSVEYVLRSTLLQIFADISFHCYRSTQNSIMTLWSISTLQHCLH